MKSLHPAIVLTLSTLFCQTTLAAQADPMCAPLRAFVASVKPSETRKIAFHTSWGTNFKDSSDPVIAASRCTHDGYTPAKSVCAYLMKHGQVEFSGNNMLSALTCLSPGTKFGSLVQWNQADFSLSYGTDKRGSAVTVQYDKDTKLGGMVLTIRADGY